MEEAFPNQTREIRDFLKDTITCQIYSKATKGRFVDRITDNLICYFPFCLLSELFWQVDFPHEIFCNIKLKLPIFSLNYLYLAKQIRMKGLKNPFLSEATQETLFK